MNKLDDFDKLLKEKAYSDTFEIPEILDEKIDRITKNLPERKVYKKPTSRVLLVAALLSVISVTTVLASNTPSVKKMVNEVISYFKDSDETKYATDESSFEMLNNEVAVSCKDEGIELTVDNIALDDNFLVIFCTAESDKPIKDYFKMNSELIQQQPIFASPRLDFKINGEEVDWGNNSDFDAYFQGDKIVKAMYKLDVSQTVLAKKFDLKIWSHQILRTRGYWSITTTVEKSDIAVESRTVKPRIKTKIDLGDFQHEITIDKVCISPLGNQIVISENSEEEGLPNKFELFDNKGNVLEVFKDGGGYYGPGKRTNSFEFFKADINTEYLTLVPIKIIQEDTELNKEKYNISEIPITINTSNEGKVVVEKIEFDKNIIKVTYHKEGILIEEPDFIFYDDNGKQVCSSYSGFRPSIDRRNGIYTKTIPFMADNEELFEIKKIGVSYIDNIELLKEQQIKIDLQK